MNNEENPYYIVEFCDGMQLIPHTWLNMSKTKAYWPNFTNITKYDKAVQFMEPVGKNWMLYDVRILGNAQSFESGKRKLKKAEITSDLNTDVSDAEKSKKDRRLRAAKKYDSDTDSDIQFEESILLPFPNITANKAITSTKTISDKKIQNVQNVDTDYTSSSFQSDDTLPSCSATVSYGQKRNLITELPMKTKKVKKDIGKNVEDDKENLHTCISAGEEKFRQFVVKNMVNITLSLKRYESILTNILAKMDTSNVLQKEDSTFIKDTIDEFPIKDSETLQTIEHRLKTDDSYKNSVIKTLSMVGGNNLKSIITNILTRALTNSVAAEYSWLGGKKKLVFSHLYLWKIILSVVRRHIPHAVEAEISQHIKIWLAHATERLQREEKKAKNVALFATNKETTVSLVEVALQKDIIISPE